MDNIPGKNIEQEEDIFQNTNQYQSNIGDYHDDYSDSDDHDFDSDSDSDSSDSIQQQNYQNRNTKKNEEHNQILNLISPKKKIRDYIKQQNKRATIHVDIIIKDKELTLQLCDIALNLIDKNCVSMNIQLSGFKTNQSDFDQFCTYFTNFPYLKSLKFRYYNKHVQYLDSLFQSVVNIEKVFINLQDFKKIKFQQEFKEPIQGIKDFGINLKNVTFKTKEEERRFENYLCCLKNLTDFRIELKDKSHLKLLLLLPKNTNITVILSNLQVDISLCDSLVSLKHEHNLNIVQVQTGINLLIAYLSSKGLELVNNPVFIDNSDSHVYLVLLSEQDLVFTANYPKQFQDLVERDYSGIKFLFSYSAQRRFKNSEKITDRIIKVIPLLAKVNDIYFDKYLNETYFPYYTQYYKRNGVWRVSSMRIIDTLGSDTLFERLFEHLISFRVIDIGCCLLSLDQVIQFMKKIQEHRFLIFYEMEFDLNEIQNGQEQLQIRFEMCSEQRQIIQKRCLDKLRFFVFKKFIFKEIPIPSQVFYDLLE